MEDENGMGCITTDSDACLATTWGDELAEGFSADRGNRVARNAVTSMDVMKAARDQSTLRTYHDTYGVSLKTAKTVTNQRHSGR
jgi:bleomycin hydrolase